jgi:hypothetical protein
MARCTTPTNNPRQQASHPTKAPPSSSPQRAGVEHGLRMSFEKLLSECVDRQQGPYKPSTSTSPSSFSAAATASAHREVKLARFSYEWPRDRAKDEFRNAVSTSSAV